MMRGKLGRVRELRCLVSGIKICLNDGMVGGKDRKQEGRKERREGRKFGGLEGAWTGWQVSGWVGGWSGDLMEGSERWKEEVTRF